MNRCLVIEISNGSQSCLGCGLSETEAMNLASTATGCDSVEVYINPTPFSVFNCKKEKAKKVVTKKAAIKRMK